MRVAIIGHRKVKNTEVVMWRICETVFDLIVNQGAQIFYFGSRSEFDRLCYAAVSDLQKLYPHVRRVYVRATYEHVEKFYEDYLLEGYEETYYPDSVRGSNELCYVTRNVAMIEACDVLLTYCDPNYEPPRKRTNDKMLAPIDVNKKPKSGTRVAVAFAKKRKKRIINLFEDTPPVR